SRIAASTAVKMSISGSVGSATRFRKWITFDIKTPRHANPNHHRLGPHLASQKLIKFCRSGGGRASLGNRPFWNSCSHGGTDSRTSSYAAPVVEIDLVSQTRRPGRAGRAP